MKTKHRILVLLLSFVFAFTVFAMAACGDDEKPKDKTSITLSKTSVTLIEGGEHQDITATVKGTNSKAAWSIDKTDVATIQYEGNTCRITPVAEGTAVVTATVAGGATATCSVTVNPAPQEVTLSLTPTTLGLVAGGEVGSVTATVTGTQDAVVWSVKSGGEYITIQKDASNGNVCRITPIAEGSAVVEASVGDKKKTCTVTVAAQPVVSISLDKDSLELVAKGETATVTATVQNSEETVQWSVGDGEDAIVSLLANGNTVTVTPLAQGTATLTAKIGEVEETVSITVARAPVELTLDTDAVVLKLGETVTADVTATVVNSEEPVRWSVGSDRIATIAGEDNVCTLTAVAVGKTTLTAHVEDEIATISVVVHPAISSLPTDDGEIELSESGSIEIITGREHEITATVIGSLEDPVWSVDNAEVISLSAETGVAVTVSALKKGDAVLTVSIGEDENAITVTLNIHVEDPTTITLDKTEAELVNEEGNNYSTSVTATVTGPVEIVTWAVAEGEDFVTLTGTDTNTITVTAKAPGTAKITATIVNGDETVTETLTVTVKAPLSVSLDNSTLELKEGGSDGVITATVEGTEEQITYEVSGDTECIEITQDGNVLTVKPLATGTATITVSVGNRTAECTVTVVGMPVWKFAATTTHGEAGGFIWHQGNYSEIKSGMTADVEVKVNGKAAVYNALLVQNGNVQVQITGSKYDDVEISFMFKQDGAAVATAKLAYRGVKEIILDNDEIKVSKDKTADISVIRINGSENLGDKSISWTIADTEGEGVATIPENSTGATVTVTAAAEGKATLTCTVGEGDDAFSVTCVITVVEGEVVEEKPVDVSDKLVQQEVYGNWNINIRFGAGEEMIKKLGTINKSSVDVSVTMNGEDCTNIIIHNVYNDSTNVYIQIGVPQDWTNSYVFSLKYKNAAGKVVAEGTFTKAPEKSLKLDKNVVNLTLQEGETVTDTVTATISSTVEGEIEWSVDSEDVATIEVSDDKLSVTVTAVAKGTATVTATVDGLTKTFTVNVLEEGEEPVEPTVPTVTDARIHEVYGGDVHAGIVLAGTDENAKLYAEVLKNFAYVKVNGVKNNDMKDMFAFGADGSYRVNVYMGGPVQKGVDYVFELCDAEGNVLLKTVAIQWN